MFTKRFSFTGSFNGGDNIDNCVDEVLDTLHPVSEILEFNCQESLVRDRYTTLLSGASKAPRSPISLKPEYERSPEDVVEGLPPEYFIPKYDPVVADLEEISSWDKDDIIQRFMTKIEETDTDKDVIIGHLTSMIDTNYDALMSCMSKVQEINVELCQAEIQIKHARMKITSSAAIVQGGPLKIQALHRKRDDLASIAETIEGVKSLKDVHRTMERRLQAGEVGEAAELALSVVDCLKGGRFEQFHALRQIGSSMQGSVVLIRQKTDRALRRLCGRRFSCAEYEGIIKSYLLLDHISSTFDMPCTSAGAGGGDQDDVFFPSDALGGLEGLAQRISRFQLADIDACLHGAAVDFILLAQQKRQQRSDPADLSEVPLHLLLRRLAGEQLAPCVTQACLALADITHTHFLITQWHSRPFDPRNRDSSFLHTTEGVASASEEVLAAEEEVEVSLRNGSGNGASKALQRKFAQLSRGAGAGAADLLSIQQSLLLLGASSSSSGSVLTRSRELVELESEALAAAQGQLLQSRAALWDELMRALVAMLRALSFSADVMIDDFVVMTQALQMLAALGKEFCGADSQMLTACIKEKTAEFFRNFHLDCFATLRGLLEGEEWRALPVNCSLLELLRTSLTKDKGRDLCSSAANDPNGRSLARNRSSSNSSSNAIQQQAEPPDKAESLLAYFCAHGNPVQALLGLESDRSGQLTPVASSPSPTKPAPSALLDLLQAELDGAKAAPTKRETALVVTHAALNGLAKFCMKYLNMLALVPAVSSEILDNLFQLFDFYLCSVFNGFVSADERSRFLASPIKTTAPAPDLSRDFEALQSYMERCLNEVVVISAKPQQPAPLTSAFSFSSSGAADGTGSSPIPFNLGMGDSSEHSTASPSSSGHGYVASSNVTVEAIKMANLVRFSEAIANPSASTCFALNERIVAAESCCFAAQILAEVKPILLKLLPSAANSKCLQYAEQVLMVARQLTALLYKSACPQLIQQPATLASIVDCAWDSKKMREQQHDWVDRLVANCRQVWEFIMMSDELADSSSLLREQVWLELCQAAFDVMLEGYSRVRKCSSEGRAMMNMDLFALHEGLNAVHLCRPPRGKHYIDAYLRAFYLSEDDLLTWVQENWQAYAYRHVHGLLSQTLSSMLANKKFKDAVVVIDALYEYDKRDGAGKVTNMLSQRFKDDTKLSNLIPGFRR